jgi:hypothetical protein
LDTPHTCPLPSAVVRRQVATYGLVRADTEVLAQWRRQPPPVAGTAVPASFIKHSEDQTVAALAAVHAAILRGGWTGRSFADWGVIAAPNFFGRTGMASNMQRYSQEGAWGVSPHTVPHHSLHAVSGTVSQILRIHGPNFGVSGGPQAGRDAFLVVAAILAEATVPGLWLILTGHDRERVPVESEESAEATHEPSCLAVALALLPGTAAEGGVHLQISPQISHAAANEFTLAEFVAALGEGDEPRGGSWRMPGGGSVELEVIALSAGSRR